MAEGKKSFTAYCDWGDVFDALNDEQAGVLVKHLFDYVRDKNPHAKDETTKFLFIQMKSALKRDLKKWESVRDRNALNGSKGGRPKKPKKPTGLNGNPKNPDEPKKAVSVSVSDSVREIDVNIYNKKQFLKDWNELRNEHLNKPSFLNRIGTNEDAANFNDLLKDYAEQDFKNALIGLFKQKELPNGNTSMQSNPSHFLKYFNSYLTAYYDKNVSLYGKKDVSI